MTQTCDFAFPLNVYARLLELEDGPARYLHYGLFDENNLKASEAQQCASDLLWQHLPAPCKLLDVGLGLGTTLQQLTAAGFAATGITPDAQQIAFALARHGPGLSMLPVRFEDFDTDAGQWQAILFQESSQYIDDIDLFEHCHHLLAEDGEIIVMDEFVRRWDSASGVRNLHDLDHFLRLAERFGFEIISHLDLSARAAPTVDWLLAGTKRHAEQLEQELGVSTTQLQALDASNIAYRKHYAEGRYGYFLLRLKRSKRPRWLPGRMNAANQNEMRALFATVFGHAMSEAHWRWKYGDGRGRGIGVWTQTGMATDAPQLVAHYGGLTREILYFGQPARALQCVDVMVAKMERGTLSRRGPMFLATATCLEHDLGDGTPHCVGFGFPNLRAFQLPEKLGLYALVGRLVEVRWPTQSTRPSLQLAVRPLRQDAPDADDKMNACWSAMQSSLGQDFIIGVRDARYLRHRYFSHPDKSYSLYVVQHRFGGKPLGLLVLRVIDDPGSSGRRCELLDVVCSLPDLPLMLHHARRIAHGFQCDMLFSWCSDNLIPLLSLPADADVLDLEICIPANRWTTGPAIEAQRGKWWLTGGDTDFR